MKDSISVVMATYNGERYIRDQIESIIVQLCEHDELIISDDGSSDATLSIVHEYAVKDKRIKIVEGPRCGVVKNFENALKEVHKDLVMFADQDDIWMPNKLDEIRDYMTEYPEVMLTMHDMYIANDEEITQNRLQKTSFSIRPRRHGYLYNLIYNGYYGCCMTLRRSLVEKIVPFPEQVSLYDQWISLVAEKQKKSVFVECPLIVHRYHGSNFSKKRSLWEKVKLRKELLFVTKQTLRRWKE